MINNEHGGGASATKPGGRLILWDVPDGWAADLRRTFRGSDNSTSRYLGQ